MSTSIWMQCGGKRNLRSYEATVWRVVEAQHRALLDREPLEGALELFAGFDCQVLVWPVLGLSREKPDRPRPTSALPGLGVAGVGEDPVEPRLEALGIPQGADLAPGGQQRGLDSVVRKVEIAQDPERDRHASVAGQASQGVEGLSIALLRLDDQCCVHPTLRPESSRPSGCDRTGEFAEKASGSTFATG